MKSIVNQSPSSEGEIKNHAAMKRTPTDTLKSLPVPLQTNSNRLNELFLSLLHELDLDKLDYADLTLLSVFTEGYLLKNDSLLSKLSDEKLLLQIEKLGGKNLSDAVEGLGLLLADSQLSSLGELDLFLDQQLYLVHKNLPLTQDPFLQEQLDLELDETQ